MKVYEFKGKPYEIVTYSKIKVNGEWQDVVIYKTLYHNPDGDTWVRFVEDFESNFKLKQPDNHQPPENIW